MSDELFFDDSRMLTTPMHVHTPIVQDAAAFGNRMAKDSDYFPHVISDNAVFIPINVGDPKFQRFRLGLTGFAQALPPEQKALLSKLAYQAMRRAILKNGRVFGGLITGYAREGVNYFDRYQRRRNE